MCFATYTIRFYETITFWIVWLRTGIVWNQIWTVWFLYVSEEVSYRLTLPPQLSHVHNIFRVSLLRESLLSFLSCDTLIVWFEVTCYVSWKTVFDRQDRVMRNQVFVFCIIWYVPIWFAYLEFRGRNFLLEGKKL